MRRYVRSVAAVDISGLEGARREITIPCACSDMWVIRSKCAPETVPIRIDHRRFRHARPSSKRCVEPRMPASMSSPAWITLFLPSGSYRCSQRRRRPPDSVSPRWSLPTNTGILCCSRRMRPHRRAFGGPIRARHRYGWIKAHHMSVGFPYERGRVRVDRLAEAITVIKGCWSDPNFEFRGEHYQVDLDGGPLLVQQPHPPLLIGGAGPRLLRLAGREADIVGITLTYGQTGFDTFGAAIATSGDRIADQLSWVREGAGDRFPQLELSVMVYDLVATADADSAVETIAGRSGRQRARCWTHRICSWDPQNAWSIPSLSAASGSGCRRCLQGRSPRRRRPCCQAACRNLIPTGAAGRNPAAHSSRISRRRPSRPARPPGFRTRSTSPRSS